jgi:hypothetical protein
VPANRSAEQDHEYRDRGARFREHDNMSFERERSRINDGALAVLGSHSKAGPSWSAPQAISADASRLSGRWQDSEERVRLSQGPSQKSERSGPKRDYSLTEEGGMSDSKRVKVDKRSGDSRESYVDSRRFNGWDRKHGRKSR